MFCPLWFSGWLFIYVARVSAVFINGHICILNAGVATGALQGHSHNALLHMGNTFSSLVEDLASRLALDASKWGTQVVGRTYGEAMSGFPMASKIITKSVGSKSACILVPCAEELFKWKEGNIYRSQMLYPKNVHI